MFKKLGNYWLRSLQLKRECGASLNARELRELRELTREKKFDMGDNLSPEHCPNRKTFTSEIQVCRFGRRLKVASLES